MNRRALLVMDELPYVEEPAPTFHTGGVVPRDGGSPAETFVYRYEVSSAGDILFRSPTQIELARIEAGHALGLPERPSSNRTPLEMTQDLARNLGRQLNEAGVPLRDHGAVLGGQLLPEMMDALSAYCTDAYACTECGDGLSLGWLCRCGSTWRRS